MERGTRLEKSPEVTILRYFLSPDFNSKSSILSITFVTVSGLVLIFFREEAFLCRKLFCYSIHCKDLIWGLALGHRYNLNYHLYHYQKVVQIVKKLWSFHLPFMQPSFQC